MRISDWSSDVCSSDLHHRPDLQGPADEPGHAPDGRDIHARPGDLFRDVAVDHDRNALAGAARRPRPQPGEGRLMIAWSFALEILPLLARAALVTVEATILGLALAAVLGLYRQSVGEGEGVYVRVHDGGCRNTKK